MEVHPFMYNKVKKKKTIEIKIFFWTNFVFFDFKSAHDPHLKIGNEETFQQDFLIILKRSFQIHIDVQHTDVQHTGVLSATDGLILR